RGRRQGLGGDHVARVTGGHVDGTGGRRAERGPERVVAHGEVLGGVPQRGHRVAVVVVEILIGVTRLTLRVGPGTGGHVGQEFVHGPVVEGVLLRRVAVVLVTSQHVGRGGRVEPGRVHPVGVGPQQVLVAVG